MNVLTLLSNKVWGGGERYSLDLCRRLEADGHSVAAISRGIEAVDAPFQAAGIPTGRLPLRGAFDIVSPIRLAKVLNHMSAPIVVHVHNFKDAGTALRARRLMRDPSKVRVVCTRHLVKPAKTNRSSLRIYSDLDAIVFVSETARKAFLSTNPDIDTTKLHVVHNVINPKPGETPPHADDSVRIVFTGRVCVEKGIDTLLKAFARLDGIPNLKLIIAGTGSPRDIERFTRLARTLAIADKIEWTGHLSDPWPLMRSADIGVLPSHVCEAFPLSVLEFMHCGVPVVATDNGGQRESISDGVDGILVPPADADALAAALRVLATDTALRKRMGAEAARKTAANSYDDFYNAILKIYEGQ